MSIAVVLQMIFSDVKLLLPNYKGEALIAAVHHYFRKVVRLPSERGDGCLAP